MVNVCHYVVENDYNKVKLVGKSLKIPRLFKQEVKSLNVIDTAIGFHKVIAYRMDVVNNHKPDVLDVYPLIKIQKEPLVLV